MINIGRRRWIVMTGAAAIAAGLPSIVSSGPPVSARQRMVSLHSADPGEDGAHEIDYVGYARQPGFLGSDQPLDFPSCLGGLASVTHLGVWQGENLLACGTVEPRVAVGVGITVRLTRIMLVDSDDRAMRLNLGG